MRHRADGAQTPRLSDPVLVLAGHYGRVIAELRVQRERIDKAIAALEVLGS